MTRAARVGIVVAAVLLRTAAARAAFELRDASPAALGAVSLEEAAGPIAPPERSCLRVEASRARLFDAPDLAADRVALSGTVFGGCGGVGWTLVHAPGARESTVEAEWSQGTGPLALRVRAERLDFSVEGARGLGGFAAGGGAEARLLSAPVAVTGYCGADRMVRSGPLERAGVRPALSAGLLCDAQGARILYAERWDAEGARSPRIVLDLPLSDALAVRFGRGGGPGRVGVALAARVGGLEISCGRLDFASGGTITAVGVAWAGRPGAARRSANRSVPGVPADRVPPPRARPRHGPPPDAAPSIWCRGAATAPRPSAPRPVPLLAFWPSVIMRRRGRIRLAGGLFALIAAWMGATPACGAPADTSGAWLPAPKEDVEVAERLDQPPAADPARGSVIARFGRSAGGVWRTRQLAALWHAAARGGPGRARALELGLVEGGPGPSASMAVAIGAVRVAAGRLALSRAPWLLSRRLDLARSYARVPEARAVAVGAGPPAGATVPAVSGVATGWAVGGVGAWALGGRRIEDGAPMAAAGGAVRGRRGDAALAAARSGDGRWLVSAAVAWRRERARGAVELLAGAGRPAVAASAETREGSVRLWCRWRLLPGEARPAAGEAGVVAAGRLGSARLTYRAWTRAALADNGAVELEGATVLPGERRLRARVGERPAPGAAPEAESRGAGPRERYVLLDATLARAGSRSLALVASARRSGGGGALARMLGARLRAGSAGGSRVTLSVQASRSSAGAPALGSDPSASGETTLADRVRSGVVVAARAVLRRGPIECGWVWEREEDVGGERPRSASLWTRWRF